MSCDIEHADNIEPGWLKCRDHDCAWMPDFKDTLPVQCPCYLVYHVEGWFQGPDVGPLKGKLDE